MADIRRMQMTKIKLDDVWQDTLRQNCRQNFKKMDRC